ncbi:MAG: permease [Pedosphaera sp.]|nr:permease [Pedosphaera sp.]
MLSMIAGSADVTSFLGLGLFSAHVTGNLVILTAQILGRGAGATCLVLSLPLFILVLGLTRLLVAGLEALDINSLRPLLLLQFLLLGGTFALGIASDHHPDPEARSTLLAGQLGVAAMAVQNALVQLSLHGVPPTAVMTTNLTRFIMDASEVLLGHDPAEMAEARHRAKHLWPVIVGFIAGAGLGAVCFAAAGLKSLGLPAGLALLALVMSLAVRPVGRKQ